MGTSHIKYALACALLASTNSILLGYDIGVMSGAVLFIKDNLKISSTQVENLVGSLNVCSLIGSFASGKTSDWIGRLCSECLKGWGLAGLKVTVEVEVVVMD
ncbi:putative major facilitator, sugar transporter, MFS transporter superfamily [Helianthus annuus]|nr:putative major facilitator, sugar transporter, MFS transporter superfamily [Helianthus annuus]